MSRILAIKDPDGEREVDYSTLSSKEIERKIKSYEKKFGSFSKFLRGYDCESGSPGDYLTLYRLGVPLERAKNQEAHQPLSREK